MIMRTTCSVKHNEWEEVENRSAYRYKLIKMISNYTAKAIGHIMNDVLCRLA